MNNRVVRIQLLALGAAAMVVATLAFSVVHGIGADADGDAEARKQLGDLARLDSALEAETLEAVDGLRPNYDRLNDVDAQLKLAVDALDTGRIGALAASNEVIKHLREEVRTKIDAKRKFLDDLKLRHAILTNSSQYFPEALEAADDADAESLAAVRGELKTRMLAWSLAPTDERKAGLEAFVTDVKTRPVYTDSKDVKVAVRHAEKIFTTAPSLKHDTKDMMDVDAAAAIGLLGDEYTKVRRGIEQQQGWTGGALAATSIALLGALAWVLRRISITNASARRFVPYELLQALGRASLADVRRGDSVKKKMSILFADIRNFTTIAEARTAKENFDYMNLYLAAMQAPIQQHHGFITEYRGDGIIALFPGDADDAVRAGLAMFEALKALNGARNEEVRIGIGVHTGDVMLGTFGSADRMNAGVISAAVVIASRVEGLTKYYGIPMIVSGKTWEDLDHKRYIARTVDRVRVKGATTAMDLHQVVDVNDAAAPEKRALFAQHDAALGDYVARRFDVAQRAFASLAAADPVAAVFENRARGFASLPPASDWLGVHDMETK